MKRFHESFIRNCYYNCYMMLYTKTICHQDKTSCQGLLNTFKCILFSRIITATISMFICVYISLYTFLSVYRIGLHTWLELFSEFFLFMSTNEYQNVQIFTCKFYYTDKCTNCFWLLFLESFFFFKRGEFHFIRVFLKKFLSFFLCLSVDLSFFCIERLLFLWNLFYLSTRCESNISFFLL